MTVSGVPAPAGSPTVLTRPWASYVIVDEPKAAVPTLVTRQGSALGAPAGRDQVYLSWRAPWPMGAPAASAKASSSASTGPGSVFSVSVVVVRMTPRFASHLVSCVIVDPLAAS